MSYQITIVAGVRPNFIKIAPIIHSIMAVKATGEQLDYRLVHTGQHYDKNMSGSFFQQLEIPEPHINLECSGFTQAEQTASIMIAFEKELFTHPADLVVVVGDVTSTMACTLVAQKLQTKVAHVEGGIRSYDWNMPEEINRLVTDSITNYFFTTSEIANQNLLNSGVKKEQLFLVGNTMIDTLLKQRPKFKQPKIWDMLKLSEKSYLVMTLHRPANVDQESQLKTMIDEIMNHTEDYSVIFPVHPRTAKVLNRLNINYSRLHQVPPLSYLEFNYLVEHSKAVITDSGGITEEASVMRVPCMTLRDNTERPETIDLGTNVLVGTNPEKIQYHLRELFRGSWKDGSDIPLWDGKTATRIIDVILSIKKENCS